MKRRLALADERIGNGADRLARLEEIVSDLERDGYKMHAGRKILTHLEKIQSLQTVDRDRIWRDLSALSRKPRRSD